MEISNQKNTEPSIPLTAQLSAAELAAKPEQLTLEEWKVFLSDDREWYQAHLLPTFTLVRRGIINFAVKGSTLNNKINNYHGVKVCLYRGRNNNESLFYIGNNK